MIQLGLFEKMAVSDQERAQGALSREWLIARIVVIGGLIIAVGAIAYFGWIEPMMLKRQELSRLHDRAQALSTAVTELCASGLTSAQNYGIVPPYGRLATNSVYTTNVQGRYVCVAATHATKYLVVIDLLCRNLKDRRCVSLYSVRQTDGTVLYQRA